MGECEHGGCVMIIEFAKEVANKRACSNSLHPPFQAAEHQKLHRFIDLASNVDFASIACQAKTDDYLRQNSKTEPLNDVYGGLS